MKNSEDSNNTASTNRRLLQNLQDFLSELAIFSDVNNLRAQEDDFYEIRILTNDLVAELNGLLNHIQSEIDEH